MLPNSLATLCSASCAICPSAFTCCEGCTLSPKVDTCETAWRGIVTSSPSLKSGWPPVEGNSLSRGSSWTLTPRCYEVWLRGSECWRDVAIRIRREKKRIWLFVTIAQLAIRVIPYQINTKNRWPLQISMKLGLQVVPHDLLAHT